MVVLPLSPPPVLDVPGALFSRVVDSAMSLYLFCSWIALRSSCFTCSAARCFSSSRVNGLSSSSARSSRSSGSRRSSLRNEKELLLHAVVYRAVLTCSEVGSSAEVLVPQVRHRSDWARVHEAIGSVPERGIGIESKRLDQHRSLTLALIVAWAVSSSFVRSSMMPRYFRMLSSVTPSWLCKL